MPERSATGRSKARRRASGSRTPRRAPRAVVILVAYPRRADAHRAARALVRARVMACATVTPHGNAFYRWGGKERADASTLLWGKTTAARARAAVSAIRSSHPDRVPEILILPVVGGDAAYLACVQDEVRRR
jgi:periplasmic divalent cation tolerance protein